MIKKQAKKVVESTGSKLSRGLGMPILSQGGKFIGDSIRRFFNISRIEQKETFEQAMSRMKLTENDLIKQTKRYWQQFWTFVLIACATFFYSMYLIFNNAFASGLVALLASILLVVYALRAHFWIFQIKNRKLGCTLQEWWSNKITTDSSTTDKNTLKK